MTRRTVGVDALAGLRVVDLSAWIAGAYCTRLLLDAGADVAGVHPEAGHPLRGWSASGSARAGEDGALFTHLTSGARFASVEQLHEELSVATACVWSPGGLGDPEAIRAAHPHLTVVSITPFGLTTSWRERPATEFTLQALSGGIIGLGRGAPDRPPIHVGGQVGEWLSGVWAAIGLLTRLRSRDAGSGGGLVDVSMLEVAAMCLTYYPVTYHDVLGRPMRKRRALTVPGVAQAADGLVGLGVGTGQQWLDFCVMAGHPEWAEDASLFSERGALAGAIDEWVGAQSVAEVLEVATAFRIPNAPIVDGANAADIEHFAVRGNFEDDEGLVRPRPAVRLTAGPPPAGSAAPVARPAGPLPFSGLRVLDMTAYWAGPSASHLLAMLGAEVIHVESPRRPDGARLIGSGNPADPTEMDKGPIFAALNTDKLSLTLDFTTPEGLDRLRAVVATCDVLIENFTPRVLDQIGFTYDALRQLRQDIVVLRMPGFGLDGPWRDNAAFAFVIEDASGLTALTGHPDQHPVEPYCVGDSNAGLHAACGLLLALAHRDATGAGCFVEAAMVDAALAVTAEQVLEQSAYGAHLTRDGNRGPAAAPQNLYDCEGIDEYGREPARIAIAVATDDQWHALRKALGDPSWAHDPALGTHAGRAAAHDLIDGHLAAWCAERSVEVAVDVMSDAGVPAAEVRQPHRQPELQPMIERGFFEELEHPALGPARYSTLPFRLDGVTGPLHRRHAPLLGEHTDALLAPSGGA